MSLIFLRLGALCSIRTFSGSLGVLGNYTWIDNPGEEEKEEEEEEEQEVNLLMRGIVARSFTLE